MGMAVQAEPSQPALEVVELRGQGFVGDGEGMGLASRWAVCPAAEAAEAEKEEAMKYFTPELLAECRSLDSGVAEAAAVKWQRRAEAYRSFSELLSANMTPQEIVGDYPDLELADIQACLSYAARLARADGAEGPAKLN